MESETVMFQASRTGSGKKSRLVLSAVVAGALVAGGATAAGAIEGVNGKGADHRSEMATTVLADRDVQKLDKLDKIAQGKDPALVELKQLRVTHREALKAKLRAVIELRKTDPAAAEAAMAELKTLREQYRTEELAKLKAIIEARANTADPSAAG